MNMARTGSIVLTVSVLVLAACGDDEPEAASTTTAASATTSAARYQVATEPDDVVISLTNEGGFVPVGTAFTNVPVAMITGDDRVIAEGPVAQIFPGPLLPNILQRTITPAAVQDLLADADELGLLADVEYGRDDLIADAPTTVLTITVDGTTYRHAAYALGIDEAADPPRDALEQFVAELTDLPATVGAAELGPEEPFQALLFLVQATPVDPADIAADGIEPRVVPWPPEANVRLVDAEQCITVPAAARTTFEEADQLTLFAEGDPIDGSEITYQLAVVPSLPGRSC